MPQLVKGGKFVFGWSKIGKEGCVQIPDDVIREYGLHGEDKLILLSGSKTSGGFAVSRQKLIEQSIMKGLLLDHPEFKNYSLPEGRPVKWKGRHYCWVNINKHGILKLPLETLNCFNIKEGDKLLSIRGSNKACVFVVKGPIVETAINYKGVIKEYQC
ncbi:hypothetical protein [Methanobacterium petrolearium]|uniref:hypothetical protein n=1 Tax=Methanobacterium petrolearium TaxID=710190 RepID=UPI001AE6E1B7|nr:hypothetical protein [Methanobacterium petrolearium]MBP1945980.1 bifunctional DNA-binding transcriptional regulator/antitoxin component of YhaV-PrlF toxin-antitoxin module [Methanobacterium petrolearium]BDZ72201.1 hypothetical protein GCM10025861_27180 [Methanobacterium petrolearium]